MCVRAFRWLLAVAAAAGTVDGSAAQVICSVFDRHLCAPTVCSVFRHRPCIPDIIYPFGQDLRLTIYSTQDAEKRANSVDTKNTVDANATESDRHELNSVRALFDVLRTCWVPPAEDEARAGMQMTVRFAFMRNGEIIAAPRVTYSTPGVPLETRDVYFNAIAAALRRCTPLPFSAGLGGAIAGRPIAIRFVDNRTLQGQAQGHANDQH
jgi:hypothetical protein